MNLDKLIKLVKLANNNPNDNEANLAARKVCKMIAENNYVFSPTPQEAAYGNARAPGNKGSAADDFTSIFEEMLRRDKAEREARAKQAEEQRKRAEAQRRKNDPRGWDWPGGFRQGTNWWDNDPFHQKAREPYTPPDTRVPPTNPKPESRNLKCKTCKQRKSTKFQGYEAVFECNDCQWTAYERSKTSY